MTPRFDVLGFGAVAVDDLLYVEDYPQPDTKMRVLAQRRDGGGLAGTALVAAARMGARTAYCGILGDDELSNFTIRELEREGVDCSNVLKREEARPFHSTIIVVPSKQQRTILYSATGVIGALPEQVTELLISDCRLLFVDHTVAEAGLRAAELAHASGIPVIADFETFEADNHPELVDLMRLVDHVVVGIGFAQHVTGTDNPEDMVRALSSTRRASCVVTAGIRGCWYAEGNGAVRHFPAFQVETVDTNGCGDVFHGAYAASIVRGESIGDAIRVASAAAALKATVAGSRSGIPNRDTVDRFLAANLPEWEANTNMAL